MIDARTDPTVQRALALIGKWDMSFKQRLDGVPLWLTDTEGAHGAYDPHDKLIMLDEVGTSPGATAATLVHEGTHAEDDRVQALVDCDGLRLLWNECNAFTTEARFIHWYVTEHGLYPPGCPCSQQIHQEYMARGFVDPRVINPEYANKANVQQLRHLIKRLVSGQAVAA